MAKILFAPIRLAVGWGLSPRLLGLIAVVMLVILRLTIGWHFFSEGTEKYQAGDWTAKPFFANAKGPLAGQFRSMVWDHDGALRLDRDRMLVAMASYRDRIAKHYGFDEAQSRQTQFNYASAVKQYDYVIGYNEGTDSASDDVEEYKLGLVRIETLDKDPVRDGVSSLKGQRETVRRELAQKAAPVLAAIDEIWCNYETTQNSVATTEQQLRHPSYPFRRPRQAVMDTSVIDQLVPYFDMAVGWCLLLGLFTPVASLAAAGFLGSVFLSQYPPTTGPGSSNYQLIECMACLVLASTGAGRFAGVDFFIHLIIRRFTGSPSRAA
ncbi:MAG: DoxX family protein [Planctomycetota bacterium]